MIRVAVADDQALVRGTIGLLVDTAPDLEVIGEAATGAEAVELATREQPDVLLMDIRMPGMDGIEATRQITKSEATAGVHVLILTTFDLDEYVYAAPRAGPGARRDPAGRHGTRARSPRPDRPGAVQRGDRAGPARHHGHRQDPRRPTAGQTRRPRPGPAGDGRLRIRPGPEGL